MGTSRSKPETTALAAAALVAIFHLALGGRYDLFRDELYFIVCGQHPAFGYVDQPPGVPIMAALLYKLGLGAWGLRIPAALAAGALVWLAMRFARQLGGGRSGEALTGLACAIAPMFMGMAATLNTSAFEPLAWSAIACLFVRADRQGNDRALIVAGIVAGLALQIKYAMVFWIVGLGVGLLCTPQRRLFLRPALWMGVALAAAIALPSFLWQYVHGFPFLELGAAAKGKNADIPALPFLINQLMVMNPVLAPLWITGLIAPFFVRRLHDLRFLVIAAIVVVVIVRLGHGKDYYLAPLYPTFFTIGAITIASGLNGAIGRIAIGIAGTAALAFSALVAPLALPILSPPALIDYMRHLGVAPQQQERSFKGTALPQVMADQLGWRDFVRQVEAAWNRIPAAQRASTVIKVENYGEAAALDLYGQGRLPVVSGHNQYYLWGLRGHRPTNILSVQGDMAGLRPYCRSATLLDTTWSRYAMANENGKVIAFCEGLTPRLEMLWPELKNFS
ncbi:glycosyltransferase family 39 protein [Sphingomonas sanguinis]|uniref:ArnT family glycosyltransferase n=1 Tax=Sphingomonas sanguinis TaxID=33051 RepID=UPI001C56D465|nr:glycosyltransferase family 39 protein [Sphingomonas sanguinis]QXT35991.1 glycosyltransferase family 39 protein [Sphingomonas sanguinis]